MPNATADAQFHSTSVTRQRRHCESLNPNHQTMKTKLILFASISILSGQLTNAQTNEPANDWKPAPSNQAGKEYPQVNSEGRVKFRVAAPKAQSVGVRDRKSVV